jgi:hypothetical protein
MLDTWVKEFSTSFALQGFLVTANEPVPDNLQSMTDFQRMHFPIVTVVVELSSLHV